MSDLKITPPNLLLLDVIELFDGTVDKSDFITILDIVGIPKLKGFRCDDKETNIATIACYVNGLIQTWDTKDTQYKVKRMKEHLRRYKPLYVETLVNICKYVDNICTNSQVD